MGIISVLVLIEAGDFEDRLSRAIVSDYLPGMSSRISGIGIIGIEKKLGNFMKI